MPELEAVFLAASQSEADRAERAMRERQIAFEVRPEATMRASDGTACLQGLLFGVSRGVARECRELLEREGLRDGVVEGEW